MTFSFRLILSGKKSQVKAKHKVSSSLNRKTKKTKKSRKKTF
jgi:hypothetical protein